MNTMKRPRRHIKIPPIHYIPELPITDKKDEIIDAIKRDRVVIIAGETGSGKTTQIPKFCIAAGRGIRGKIGCTQPRRIAAINVAARIEEELRYGHLEETDSTKIVGYKIRFDDTSASDTIIKVMTDGILLAETQRDPFLNEYDTIIVDEAHERSLNIDFTLGILRTLIKRRGDLKVIITSATIDTEKFSKAFDSAPIIEVSGRMYPVEVRYQPAEGLRESQNSLLLQGYGSIDQDNLPNQSNYNQSGKSQYDSEQDDQSYVEAAVEAVESIQRESRHGDILIFMPTEQDITETIELLRGRNWAGVTVLPLYARLSAAEQARIFHRGLGRKIIVSTNVAETSLTIPGVKYVIDTGFARIPHYSPRTRTTALPVTKISRSSADQRKGRCGRVENGICIRLYDEESYNSRAMFTSPEILRSNLAEVILRMISLNLGDVSSFPFIDMPSPKSVKDGFDTLLELGAIRLEKQSSFQPKNGDKRDDDSGDRGKNPPNGDSRGEHKKRNKSARGYLLTEKGRVMARIPVDPKLSRILIEADERGCLEAAVIIASALSISDPRQRPQDKIQQADQKHALFKDPASDFISLLNIWSSCYGDDTKSRNSIRKFCKDHYLSFRRMREWSDIYRQIMSVLREHGITGSKGKAFLSPTKSKQSEIGGEFYTALHKSILAGYLGNIAHKKEKNLYHAAKGQKATIFPGSGISGKAGNWIVAAEYVETSMLFARTAATIDVDWLEETGKSLCTYTWSSPHWEKKRGEVVAKEQVSLFGLVVVPERTVAYGKINPVESGEIFIRHALVEGETDIPFPFMEHNRKLIEELQAMEEKTRKRDILVTDEDIYLFYQQHLDRDFYNIRTFTKYLKDKNDDSYLRMTLEDLRQKQVDEEHLAGFPDRIKIGDLHLRLEYDFKPGSETDGVTVKIPAISAGHLLSAGYHNYSDHPSYLSVAPLTSSAADVNRLAFAAALNQASSYDQQASLAQADIHKIEPSIDWLVPGLFREKIMALVKNLPKSHRVKLLPASEKADIIAKEIQQTGRPLFYELSRFVKKRFNADIPSSAWSDEGIDPHLKMRISIRDQDDREIAASRNYKVLEEFASDSDINTGHNFEQAKKQWEIDNVTSWDSIKQLSSKGLPRSIRLSPANRVDSAKNMDTICFELFPAFSVENSKIALRLFRTGELADKSHKEGIRALFSICYEDDMSALKKDIKGASRLKGYSQFFGGVDRLNQALYDSITKHLFSSYSIRTRDEFESHAAANLPRLYATGQELISRVTEICEEYRSTMAVLQNISLKNINREQMSILMNRLKGNLEELVPPDFLERYRYNRIPELKRYVAAVRIRAERAVVDMTRDQKRWTEVAKYVDILDLIMCNSNQADWSNEKADAIDNLFWMVEEYKVSLFAQELKTAIKVSPRRLDSLSKDIDNMI